MLARLLRSTLAQQHGGERGLIASAARIAELSGQLDTICSSYASVDRSSDVLQPSCARENVSEARTSSHAQATTSARHGFDSLTASKHWSQLQQLRAYGYRQPKPRFSLPGPIADLVAERIRVKRKAAPAAPPVPKLEPRPLQDTSVRVGCIATKAGMTQEWDEHGVRVPLTVLFIDDCQVVGVKTHEVHGYTALQLGAGHKRQKCMSPSAAGWFLKLGLPFKKLVTECRVTPDALMPVGTHVRAAHYVAGQRVDVTGWTKFKGFQGVMKRWGFKGQPASHGVSLSHRAPGAIGGRQDPGKVWKGKKLPGHMGNERRTVHNCLVYKVDPERNLLYVRGQVPGPAGKSVFLRDSRLADARLRATWQLPFPTHVVPKEQLAAAPAPGDVSVVPDASAVQVYSNPKDPYLMYRQETDYFPIKWKKGE